MSSGADYFLKKTLGEDFMESLHKVELWKPGTKSTLDHEEIRTALQIVPRTIMSLLIRELIPMSIGETKEIPIFVGGDAKMRATKHERDVYSGEIEQDNKKISEFKFRSIPGVGLVIMTAFELYDMENLINAQSTPSVTPQASLPSTPDQNDPQLVLSIAKVQALIDEKLALHSLIGQVVDRKIEHKNAVHNLLLMKLTEEIQKAKIQADSARIIAYNAQQEITKKKQQISDVTKIAKAPGNAGANEYLRGMANGLEVANATVNEKEPEFVESTNKKKRPLAEFLEKREKKKEYEVHLSKGETVDCPDCGKNIFDGKLFSGCVCLGDDMERKVYIKKSEEGIKVRFSKGWDQENIEMLLEVLRKKHG